MFERNSDLEKAAKMTKISKKTILPFMGFQRLCSASWVYHFIKKYQGQMNCLSVREASKYL
ncbi:hypothetical protein BMI76_09305 [Streptococcus sp. 'caviae']|nr:hypothetical protein BMI76_09305 [Streptococcus sp. 'caviae']